MAAAAQNAGAGMLVLKFIGPLPHIANEILHPEWTGGVRVVGIHVVRSAHRAALIGGGRRGIPFVAPGIQPLIGTLRGILPLPFMRKPLPCPFGVGASVFERYPGHGLVVPARRIVAILPIFQEVEILGGLIGRCIEEFLNCALVTGYRSIEKASPHFVGV